MVVIATEDALSDEEIGVIISMSTYFMRIPGRDLYTNCIERVNSNLDWEVIGKTHLRVLVCHREHPMEFKELMPYPVWSMEATRSPTWFKSLTAYACKMGKGNIEMGPYVKDVEPLFFPASALWPVWPGQSTVSVRKMLYRSI